ncbi:MAG TPA: hypothetical protein VII92_10690, partial [Anaerolineae bacterium]
MPKQNSLLLNLLNRDNPARKVLAARSTDRGLADRPHFPLLAMVGQTEMKTALILTLINPHVGG